jgi:transcriptional regulator with XRE-family HTH domain
MSKATMATKLPRKLEQNMRIVGEQIRLARLRRNLSVAQVAERATCSPMTVARVEKGASTVAIGIYLRVLYALQLDGDILLLAQKDELGRALQDLALKHRERASKKG